MKICWQSSTSEGHLQGCLFGLNGEVGERTFKCDTFVSAPVSPELNSKITSLSKSALASSSFINVLIRLHGYCAGEPQTVKGYPEMCRFITQHGHRCFQGVCSWYAGCRIDHESHQLKRIWQYIQPASRAQTTPDPYSQHRADFSVVDSQLGIVNDARLEDGL